MNYIKLPVTLISMAALSLGSWGCATKKHVREAIAPVQRQVSDLNKQTADNKSAIGDLDRQVSIADEKAADAGKKAGEAGAAASKAYDTAMSAGQRADNARTLAEQNAGHLQGLDRTIQNLDNYQLTDTKKVFFPFNHSRLTKAEASNLDAMLQNLQGLKNYVLEIEGFTDRAGRNAYNLELSRKRADAVVRYLAAHDIPLRRIHELGVGPVSGEEARTARKESRRVDIRIFTLDAKGGGQLESSVKQSKL